MMPDGIELPEIIQGGMGVGVSNWRLARAVSSCGQLGVVSGTLLDTLLVRRLQDGDAGGHVRRAMEQFPIPGVAAAVLKRYFLPEGRAAGTPYRMLPMHRQSMPRMRLQIIMLAGFVEVFLAREGHGGLVGINLLTKIQLPNLATLYGAMLAGVDAVLMGAGIPREIPGALDALAGHRRAVLRFEVEGLPAGKSEEVTLEPSDHWGDVPPPPLRRPHFLAIIASSSLATMLVRKANGRVDGFVVEGPTAGGHNAPPRGPLTLSPRGEPVYGARDVVDLEQLRQLGVPFWLAGGAGSPEALQEARRAGAAGIQVGTLFAYAEESGIAEGYRRSILGHVGRGEVEVFTDPLASPTGYPFKVVRWPDDPAAGGTAPRQRTCDLGLLRTAHQAPDGRITYRCPAEPVDAWVRKGGAIEDTEGRRCLCNSLLADVGHAQVREDGATEPPLITSGDDLIRIGGFLGARTSYTAAEVIGYLLGAGSGAPAGLEA
jgi:NAD(P)H-dependent flavin oxidoreductase YrpB (nitropropane dioxygenase family)